MIFFIFIIVVSDRILILALKRHSVIPHFCVSGWILNLALTTPHFSGNALLGLSPVVFTLPNVIKTFKENSQETICTTRRFSVEEIKKECHARIINVPNTY